MKVLFEQKFLLGLFLFLRQLQLSIDRSLNDDWEKLVVYLKSKTSIQEVLERIISISKLDLKKSSLHASKQSLPKRLLPSFFCRLNTLTENELNFIYRRLKSCSVILSDHEPPGRQQLISLRYDLYQAEELVKGKMEKSAVKDKEYVTHFNQNKHLIFREIDELVGGAWL